MPAILSDLHMAGQSLISRNLIAVIGRLVPQTPAVMSRLRSTRSSTRADREAREAGLSKSSTSPSEQSADSEASDTSPAPTAESCASTGSDSAATTDTEQEMPYIVGHDRKRQEFYIKLLEGKYGDTCYRLGPIFVTPIRPICYCDIGMLSTILAPLFGVI
jgi:hypothetical protein